MPVDFRSISPPRVPREGPAPAPPGASGPRDSTLTGDHASTQTRPSRTSHRNRWSDWPGIVVHRPVESRNRHRWSGQTASPSSTQPCPIAPLACGLRPRSAKYCPPSRKRAILKPSTSTARPPPSDTSSAPQTSTNRPNRPSFLPSHHLRKTIDRPPVVRAVHVRMAYEWRKKGTGSRPDNRPSLRENTMRAGCLSPFSGRITDVNRSKIGWSRKPGDTMMFGKGRVAFDMVHLLNVLPVVRMVGGDDRREDGRWGSSANCPRR